MNKAIVYAKHNRARTSVKKAKPVLDLIRGKDIAEARTILSFHHSKASDMILKVLNSAIANARTNLDLSASNLYVSETFANEGPTLKRGRIVGRSRFSRIFKRTSHLVVGLSEKNEEHKKDSIKSRLRKKKKVRKKN